MTTHCKCPRKKQGLRPQGREEASVKEESQLRLSQAVCLGGVGHHRYSRIALGILKGDTRPWKLPQGPQEKSQLYPGGLCPMVTVQLSPMN